MSGLTVKVDMFEGPLDLLLHLIRKMEIDIADIPIVEVVHQYMEYLDTMKELELTLVGDYLVMAATLLSIKSAMLLPQEQKGGLQEEEEDPRTELVDMLLEYKKMKEAAVSLQEKELNRQQFFSKEASELSEYQQMIPLQPGQVTLFDLLAAFQQAQLKMTIQEQKETTVKREEVTVEEKIRWIRKMVASARSAVRFSDLVRSRSKNELVTTFLAMLEMIKEQEIRVEQRSLHEDLILTVPLSDEGV